MEEFRYDPSFDYDELDELEHKGIVEYKDFEDLESARADQTRNGGVIYTQLDSDYSDDVILSRGIRFVNRTGMYAVVRHLHVQKLKCPECGKAEMQRVMTYSQTEQVTVLFECLFSATFDVEKTDQEKQEQLDKWHKEGGMEKWLKQSVV